MSEGRVSTAASTVGRARFALAASAEMLYQHGDIVHAMMPVTGRVEAERALSRGPAPQVDDDEETPPRPAPHPADRDEEAHDDGRSPQQVQDGGSR